MSESDQKYESIIRNLLTEQRVGVLATDMDGLPYTNLIAFTVTEDLRSIFFTTLKDTRKFSNIQDNNKVTLLVDNRKNNPKDFYKAIAVTAEGKVEFPTTDEISIFRTLFLQKHPYLEDFVNSPNCVFLSINVEKYQYVYNFQNVKILRLDQ